MDTVYITGHRNPDTDSIVSAMAYAALKNALGRREYKAARLGQVSDETQLVLDRFGFQPPRLLTNVISRSEHMEDVRINMIGAVQNAAAMAQENAASIQEVTASLINAYEEIQILSDRTDELDSLSTQMKESVSVFSIDCA